MFALVDCNNFFASCEQVFHPKWEKMALVVLSNNDGCIISRSPKAKELGIKMGDPAYLYRDRKDVVMVSSNFTLYADMSQRVMQILSSHSPDVEIYSIDEAFFLLEEKDTLYDSCQALGQQIKKWTGIPVSIGVGPTKTLAKLAAQIAKDKENKGVAILNSDRAHTQLQATAVEEIWGIGKNIAQKLRRNGMYTAGQLIQADETWIRNLLGVTGFRTVLELRGVSCLDIEAPEKKKSIICSRSFGSSVTELASLQEAVATFVESAAEKLRNQSSLTSFLSVSVTNRMATSSCHIQLPSPTSYTPELIRQAKEACTRLYQSGVDYKKAGVMLSDFSDRDAIQTDWLNPTPFSKKKGDAMKVLDQINARYDKTAVQFAASGIEKKWKSNRAHTTPKFTTNWLDLLKVFAF